MKWIKTIIIGILATFAMDVAMNTNMMLFGLTPTNIHPAAAFLYNLGIGNEILSLLLHYSYGTLWALVFVYAFERNFTLLRAVLFATVLWLFMMLVYSPVIGWGFFGFGNAQLLNSAHPLHLSSIPDFLIMTLSVHIIYGLTLGFLTKKFIPIK
jgi:hypothetical protein